MKKITIPMTLPGMKEAFGQCQPGEEILATVESKSKENIVLELDYGDEEDYEEEPPKKKPSPAMARGMKYQEG